MPRVKTGPTRRKRHKKILEYTKGFRMTKSRLYKVAHEAYLHALDYAFHGRRLRKRDFRKLWIQRINAGLKQTEPSMKYSRFVKALKDNNVQLNRKVLAHLASTDTDTFNSIVKEVSQT